MKVAVIIPSCSSSRIPMLIRTIETIQKGSYESVRIVVVADGNLKINNDIKKKNFKNVVVAVNEKRMDWPYSINRILREVDSEYYIYASDDLIFPKHCIRHAMEAMERYFPNGDGVISLGRKGRCIFGLIGRKFVERFPGRQVFCPDFVHFRSDSELLRTVKVLKKIAYPKQRESQVVHFREKDETYRLARRVKERDREIFVEREAKGYKWGIDFNLVTRGGERRRRV